VVSDHIEQAWCPTCKEWTVLEVGWPCAFCETVIVKRKGGWKRPDLQGRISEPAARAIHAKYETGVSARTLGRELYRVLGYKRAETCEAAIGAAFKRYGLPRRGRIEATVLASTSSGLSPRDWRERYRRRKAAGLTIHMQPLQALCVAVRRQYPRKGAPCKRPAMFGSDYCASHNPDREQQRQEHLATMRALRSAA
jgi:hypothetical protein